MQSFKESMNNDYNQYKVKLKEQNDVFAKQLLEQYKQMTSNGDNPEDNTEKALFGTFLKLRGAIKYFNGEMNNIAVEVQDGENILKCGAIYLTGAIYEVFQDIVGKENIELREI